MLFEFISDRFLIIDFLLTVGLVKIQILLYQYGNIYVVL